MRIIKTTHILFIALIIVVVFSPSLKNDFTWDDKYLVINNFYIRSWDYISDIFTNQLYQGGQMQSNYYRPAQLLSFVMDYSIWGLNPFGYHLTNLFLHVANSILVYLILIAISHQAPLALIAAMLFAISPAISGITYYISARSDLLMALFLFLSFLSFVKYMHNKKKILYVFSIVTFIISVLCKEMAIMLLMLLPLEIFRRNGKITRGLTILLPYVIILVFYVALRFTVLNFAEGHNMLIDFSYPASIPLWARILTMFKIIPKYLGILLFPYGLHMEWFIVPARKLFQVDVLFSFAVIIFLVAMLKRLSRVNKLVIFGALWFILSLLPVLNIYPISVFFGEGWLYVPSVGFFVILGIVFHDIISPKIGKKRAGFLAICCLLYYSFFTVSYGKVWKDSITLFENVLRYEKDSPFAHLTYNNLGMAHFDKKNAEESMEYCKKSIESNPKYADAFNNLGIVYADMAKPINAIVSFRKAISLKKDFISAYCNLAHVYSNIGLQDSAARFLIAALDKDPDSYEACSSLGYVFWEKQDIDKAVYFFRKARSIRAEFYEPYYCLGALYKTKNRFKDALREYEEASRRGLSDYKFYNEIAFLYIENSRFKEAEDALRHSLGLNRSQLEAYNNLGNLYAMLGHLELAIEEYKKALEIDPDNMYIRDNLKKAEQEWKNHTYQL